MKVHYADRPKEWEGWGVAFPLCFMQRAFDSPTTRNTCKVTCKLCLRLLGAK